MHAQTLERRPLRLDDLGRTPTLRLNDIQLPTLADPFQIDDWRTCQDCRAHTPHAGAQCLCCEPG